MTREDLLKLFQVLLQMKGLPGVKFAYAAARNLKKLDKERLAVQEAMAPSKELAEFDKRRLELCAKLCEKDENGEPLIKNDTYVGLDTNPKFQEAIEALKAEYKDALDGRTKQLEEYKQLLAEEMPDDFVYKIKMADLPEAVTAEQLLALEPMVEDFNQ